MTHLQVLAAAVLVMTSVGCWNGSGKPEPTTAQPPNPKAVTAQHDRCRDAFDDYASSWSAARSQQLREGVPDMDAELVADLVEVETRTLPKHGELRKMRDIHTVENDGVETPAWRSAYASAERAIDLCGAGAKRP